VNVYLLSVILGIVEGLTEFLPVSSTAHLRLSERLLGISLDSGYWKMYSIVIQLGAILSLLVYFGGRIARFMRSFPRGEQGDRTILNHPLSLTLVAFIVTAVPSLLLAKRISKNLENLHAIAIALLVGGTIMWVVDAAFKRPRTEHMEEMSLAQAIWIGAVQVLSAFFPGTSRSMSTIAAGQVTGMSRESSLEFSFFLSIPTMVAATGYELLKEVLHRAPATAAVEAISLHDARGWIVLGIGMAISFVVALAVVAWFMNWVRKHGFVPFAVYRIVLGLIILLML
jgi:undecaprenyl-diphosphatase